MKKNPTTSSNSSFKLKDFCELFFDYIDNKSGVEVAGFLRDVEKKQNFDVKYKVLLIEKINRDLNQNNFYDSQNLISIIHSFANLGYKKEDLENLNIRKISEIIERNFNNFSPKKITEVLGVLSKLGYSHFELDIASATLSKAINKKILNFENESSIRALSSLLKMGYLENPDDALKVAVQKLVSKAEVEIRNNKVNADGVSSFVHALAKAGMFEKLFSLHDEISSGLNSKTKISSNSAFALMQTQMRCDLFFDRKFFSDSDIAKIANQYQPSSQKTKKSLLQDGIENSFAFEDAFEEIPVYSCGEKNVRLIDIGLKKEDKDGESIVFIEVEGKHHYGNAESGEILPTFSTKERDLINEAAISRLAAENPNCKYFHLTLPYNEISQAREVGRIDSFLAEKVANAKIILPKKVPDLSLAAEENLKNSHEEKSSSEVVEPEELVKKPELSQEPKEVAEVVEDKIQQEQKTQESQKEDLKSISEKTSSLLSQAIIEKDYDSIVRLIENGCEVNQVENGKTPFQIALENDDMKSLDILVGAGAEISANLKDDDLMQLVMSSMQAEPYKINLARAAIYKFKNSKKTNSLINHFVRGDHSSDELLPVFASALEKRKTTQFDGCEFVTKYMNSSRPKMSIVTEFMKAGFFPEVISVNAMTSNLDQPRQFVFPNDSGVKEFLKIIELFGYLINNHHHKVLNNFISDKLEEICCVALAHPYMKQIKSSLLTASISCRANDSFKKLIEEGFIGIDEPLGFAFATHIIKNMSPLHICLLKDNFEAAEYLIEKGANLNFCSKIPNLIDESKNPSIAVPPFFTAILNGAPDHILDKIISKNSENNKFGGASYLHVAIMGGFNRGAIYLLSKGNVDVSDYPAGNKTIFQMALEKGCSEQVIVKLIEAGANTKMQDGASPMKILGERGYREAVGALLQKIKEQKESELLKPSSENNSDPSKSNLSENPNLKPSSVKNLSLESSKNSPQVYTK